MSQVAANVSTMANKEREKVTDLVTLVIYGTPTPKGRPRFTRTGRAYTPAQTKAFENEYRMAWLLTAGKRAAHDGPVSVEYRAYFVPPQSWPKWKREAALAGQLLHTSKPDWDNLAKTMDGLNGLAWLDDSQVFHAIAVKQYATVARTEIQIRFWPNFSARTIPKGTN